MNSGSSFTEQLHFLHNDKLANQFVSADSWTIHPAWELTCVGKIHAMFREISSPCQDWVGSGIISTSNDQRWGEENPEPGEESWSYHKSVQMIQKQIWISSLFLSKTI